MGDRASLAWGNSSMGAAYNEMGEFGKARECLGAGIEISERSDDQWKLCAAHLFMGDLLRNTGELDSAFESYSKSLVLAKQLDSPDLAAEAYIGLAETSLLKGDVESASSNAESARKTSSEAGLSVEMANALRARGLVLAAQGRRWEADAEFLRSHERYSGIENPVGKAKLLLDWGRSAAAWGDAEAGRDMLAAARETFSKSEMKAWAEKCDRLLCAHS